jgi:hypothetical protein
MSIRHLREIVANAKAGKASSGWLADMAVIELGEIVEACGIVMTERGAKTDAGLYVAARDLLVRVGRGR